MGNDSGNYFQESKLIELSAKLTAIESGVKHIDSGMQGITKSVENHDKTLLAHAKYIYLILGGAAVAAVFIVPRYDQISELRSEFKEEIKELRSSGFLSDYDGPEGFIYVQSAVEGNLICPTVAVVDVRLKSIFRFTDRESMRALAFNLYDPNSAKTPDTPPVVDQDEIRKRNLAFVEKYKLIVGEEFESGVLSNASISPPLRVVDGTLYAIKKMDSQILAKLTGVYYPDEPLYAFSDLSHLTLDDVSRSLAMTNVTPCGTTPVYPVVGQFSAKK